MSVQVGPSVSFSGAMRMQVNPSLLVGANLNVSVNDFPASISVVLTSTALYMDLPGGTGQPGKPWVEIMFSSPSGNLGTALTRALQETQSSNPLVQTQLLATSASVREVGTAVISGVRTTEYSGVISLNQPVTVTAPPAGEVIVTPASVFFATAG